MEYIGIEDLVLERNIYVGAYNVACSFIRFSLKKLGELRQFLHDLCPFLFIVCGFLFNFVVERLSR